MKKPIAQLLFLLLLIVGTVLILRSHRNAPYQKDSGMVFGTVYHVTYQYADNLKPQIEAQLQKVDNALSMFNPQSIIAKVNNGQATIPNTTEGRMFTQVISMALDISEETHGAFDITVAPLVNAWGFGVTHGNPPTPSQVDSLLQLVGYKNIRLDIKHRTIHASSPHGPTKLDCSAIAKGYGVDAVAQMLRDLGISNFMVEIGGEVITSGQNDKKQAWRIGVSKPTDDSLSTSNELQTVLQVSNRAMATSGNYRNFYYRDGKKYAHTIDPKTGQPVQHNILSATVLADDCATADAYATAFMVMGIDSAQAILKKHPQLTAYLIYTDPDGNYAVWQSPGLEIFIVK